MSSPHTHDSYDGPAHWLPRLIQSASALLVLFTLYLAWVNAVPGPLRDDWDMLPLLERFFAGSWSLADLWEPYGGAHRVVLAKLLFMADYRLFHGTNVLQTLVSVLLQLALLALWLHALRGTATPLLRATGLLVAALFLFNAAQLFNITYAFDCQWFISTAAATAALYLYCTRAPGWRTVSAIGALGVLASLGNAAGWMVWPSLLLCALWLRRHPREIAGWFAWLAVMAHAWLGGLGSSAGPLPELPWQQWLAWAAGVLYFTIRLLGNPWNFLHPASGLLLGLAGTAGLLACLARRPPAGSSRVFLAIALYAATSTLAIAIGRSGFEQELTTPRFFTVTLLFWAGLLCHLLLAGHTRRGITPAIALLALAVAGPIHLDRMRGNTAQTENARHAQFALMIGLQDWDAIQLTLAWYMRGNGYNPGQQHAAFLQQHRLAYYQLPQAPFIGTTLALPHTPCSDAVGEATALARPGEYSLLFRQPLGPGLWLVTDHSGLVNGAVRQYRSHAWLWPLAWLPADRLSWLGYARSAPHWAVRVDNGHPACRLPITH